MAANSKCARCGEELVPGATGTGCYGERCERCKQQQDEWPWPDKGVEDDRIKGLGMDELEHIIEKLTCLVHDVNAIRERQEHIYSDVQRIKHEIRRMAPPDAVVRHVQQLESMVSQLATQVSTLKPAPVMMTVDPEVLDRLKKRGE
jgi:hypothetical protein